MGKIGLLVLIALALIGAHAVGLGIEGLFGIGVLLIGLMFLMKFSNQKTKIVEDDEYFEELNDEMDDWDDD